MSKKIITCLDFGAADERFILYPDILFCNKCLRFEEESKQNKKIKRSSAPFRCEAKHTRKPNLLILKRFRAEKDAQNRNNSGGRIRRTAALKADELLKAGVDLIQSDEEENSNVVEIVSVGDTGKKRKDDCGVVPPMLGDTDAKRSRTVEDVEVDKTLEEIGAVSTDAASFAVINRPLTSKNKNNEIETISSTSLLLHQADDIGGLLDEKGMTLKAIELTDARRRIKILEEENELLSRQKLKLEENKMELELELKATCDELSFFQSKASSAERELNKQLDMFNVERKELMEKLDTRSFFDSKISELEQQKKVLDEELQALSKKRRNTRRALTELLKRKSSQGIGASISQAGKNNSGISDDLPELEGKGYTQWYRLEAGDDPTNAITRVLSLCMPRSKLCSRAYKIVKVIWSDSFLGGLAQGMMIDHVRMYLRKHVFNVPNVLRALDLSGIKCGYTAVEILRKIDAPGRYQRSILPSSSALHNGAELVQKRGAKIVPFELFTTADGEGFQFNVEKCLKAGIKLYQLEEVAKVRSISISLTSDGAALNHRLSHLCAGIKWNDVATRDPFTGRLLLLQDSKGNVTGGLQSRDLTMPLRLEVAKDNKETAERFRPIYSLLQSGKIEDSLGLKKFDLTFPHDKKAHWTFLDRGGAAKVKTNFCFCCSMTSDNIARESDTPCPSCKEKKHQNPSWRCYHQPILADGFSDDMLKQWEDEVKILIDDIDERNSKLKEAGATMRIGKVSEIPVAGDTSNIDYLPQTEDEVLEMNCAITDELMYRQLPITGSARERRQLLRQHLEAERIAAEIKEMMQFAKGNDKAFYGVLKAIPCILHLENRVGLTILENVLRKGLQKAIDGDLNFIQSTGRLSRALEFQKAVVKVMEEKVLGSPDSRAQWRFPVSDNDNTVMAKLKMENARTALGILHIEEILNIAYNEGDSEKEEVLSAMDHYMKAMTLLEQKNEYSDTELASFQEHVDRWYQTFVSIFSRSICTNYTHDLASGHVLEYIKLYGPLWRFSNEGWEALNALIKSFYFRKTFRGGRNKNSKVKSRILPIANFCQRKIMWMLGEGMRAFENKDPCSGLSEDSEELLAEFLSEGDEDFPVELKGNQDYEINTLDDVDDQTFALL